MSKITFRGTCFKGLRPDLLTRGSDVRNALPRISAFFFAVFVPQICTFWRDWVLTSSCSCAIFYLSVLYINFLKWRLCKMFSIFLSDEEIWQLICAGLIFQLCYGKTVE